MMITDDDCFPDPYEKKILTVAAQSTTLLSCNYAYSMDRAYQSQLDPGSNIDDANVAGDFIFFARNCMGEHITENIWR